MRPIILHMHFKFDTIYFADYAVIAEKPRVGHLLRIFRAPSGKNMRLVEKQLPHFLIGLGRSPPSCKIW